MSTQRLLVSVQDTPDTFSVDVPLLGGDILAPYIIKRYVEEKTGISPLNQRLSLVSSSIQVPQKIHVTKRLKDTSASFKVTLASFNVHLSTLLSPSSTSPPLAAQEVFTIECVPSDTLMDLKFKLSEQTHLLPEYHRITSCTNDPIALKDSDLVPPPSGLTQFLRVLYQSPPTSTEEGWSLRSSLSLCEYNSPEQRTPSQLFLSAVDKFSQRNLLGTRYLTPSTKQYGPYQWQTFAQVKQRVIAFGSGLLNLGLQPEDRIGIMAVNRSEWMITQLTCFCYGFVSVTLYDTLGPKAIEYITDHAQLSTLVLEPKALSQIQSLRDRLQYVIVMDDQKDQQVNPNEYTHLFSEVETQGTTSLHAIKQSSPESLCSICYTSGTTGNPKGVMLTGRNFVAAVAALNLRYPATLDDANDTMLSYLPLAHIYGIIAELCALQRGNGIGYYHGDTTQLVQDVEVLKPSFFPGVPRVWQRIYDKVSNQIASSSFIKKSLYEYAYKSKQRHVKECGIHVEKMHTTMWDSIVFKAIKAKFGGNLKLVVSGSAPLAGRISEWMRIALQCDYGEGYGLTETGAATTSSAIEDSEFGHVGTPVACVEVKLVDVPEMNYLTSDTPCPRGEIWVRGASVFLGYYREVEKTRDAITSEGWFKTGDIGKWRSDGRLSIIDRKKNIFKLAQGEYIRPEYIENVYKQSEFIGNLFVYGDSFQRYLVAIIVPDWEKVDQWAKSHEIQGTHAELCGNARVKRTIQEDMKRVAKREELRGFEVVARFALCEEDFTVENGLVTPSMKLKRHQAKLKFQQVIQQLYEKESESEIQAKL